MDNTDSYMVQTDHLISIWHDYRTPVVVLVLLALLAFQAILRRKSERENLLSPSVAQPSGLSMPLIEEPLWFDGKQPIIKPPSDEKIPGAQDRSVGVLTRPRLAPKRVKGSRTGKPSKGQVPPPITEPVGQDMKIQPMVFFSSLTGNTESYAKRFVEDLKSSLDKSSSSILAPQMHDLSYIEYDDFFVTAPKVTDSTTKVRCFYLLLLPTYNIDTVLSTFLAHLQETHHDFRIDTAPMSDLLGYSVFGFGDREGWPTEDEGFCSQAREVDKWMAKLTCRKRAFPLGMGDVKSNAIDRLEDWRLGVEEALQGIALHGGLGEGVSGSGDAVESDEEDIAEVEDLQMPSGSNTSKPIIKKSRGGDTKVDDLEDLGSKVPRSNTNSGISRTTSSPLAVDFTTYLTNPNAPQPLKEMVPVSSPTFTALVKQGYSIIGSHSGVKICRWTKSALRGRGSCYKYSFYGIKSHLCMETTPSLSCSNKCVFCWRHGTNPVGTTWRWKVDPPDMIFEGAKQAHLKKIKMMRGVPGVRAERFQEAMRIRHCALSLVGEPIFYPHINEFVGLLHRERISSFLVCNAQHPEQLEALKVVTQLYVSIDASNRDSLRKVDRPLHRDFWERFLRCLDILREKRFSMRTVFRLTLVKGFNIEDEVEGYADLVARGQPCFVEVKGVTYCGTSSSAGAGLTMQNVPFYEEVTAFVVALNEALERRGLDYGIAAEHAHSCCVLIASKRFLIGGKWHTLIDYDKFFECLDSGREFAPEDYVGAATPEWATWGNGGFDPADERVYRKGKNKAIGQGGGGVGVEQ
ncbi:hypothetical protein MMC24_000021 [Lignoscripta atroalba]|nr:hypothetical protein [Lignoscripta atroalba]